MPIGLLHLRSRQPSATIHIIRVAYSLLGGYADILLEMSWHKGLPADDDRHRMIEAYSRHEATPRRLVIELSPTRKPMLDQSERARCKRLYRRRRYNPTQHSLSRRK